MYVNALSALREVFFLLPSPTLQYKRPSSATEGYFVFFPRRLFEQEKRCLPRGKGKRIPDSDQADNAKGTITDNPLLGHIAKHGSIVVIDKAVFPDIAEHVLLCVEDHSLLVDIVQHALVLLI